MPDNTPAAPAPSPQKRKSPGPLDSRLLQQLGKDEAVVNAAIDELGSDPDLATALGSYFLDRDNTIPITVANLTRLAQQAAGARETGANATAGDAETADVTDDESSEARKAIAAIRGVQARAKAKYEESNPARLAAYYVGQPLRSRAQITQAGTAAYTLLRTTDDTNQPITPQDSLPGYDQARIDQLKQDLGSYISIETEQSGAKSKAQTARLSFEEACEQVSRRRRKLQLAIDAERPYGSGNTPLRTRLGLPVDRGMS